MDKMQLNQARQYLVDRLIVISGSSGQEKTQDFLEFFQKQMIIPSQSLPSPLQFLLFDSGEVFQRLSELSVYEQKQLPCQFDVYCYSDNTTCTRLTFEQPSKILLEQFFDHLSCFIALYIKEGSRDLRQTVFRFS